MLDDTCGLGVFGGNEEMNVRVETAYSIRGTAGRCWV